jgi:hypothetical protein
MTCAALCLAVAYVLPFLTGQIPTVGKMLCPMHLPILLCGFLCGWGWGLTVGAVAPLLRSLTLGVPALFPMAAAMSLELATYGAIAGLLYYFLPPKKGYLLLSLILSMLAGRVVWGGAMTLFTNVSGGHFGWRAFLTGAFVEAVPGILIQLFLVPTIVILVGRGDFSQKRTQAVSTDEN